MAALIFNSAQAEMTQPSEATGADVVVLLHGLGRSPLSMKRLEWTLRRDGYRVLNLGYASQRGDVSALARDTLGLVFADAKNAGATIHIVTHSLGGILVRQFLHEQGVPANLGHVVMIAPPNQGSELTDKLRDWWLYRWVNGPAGQVLGTASTDLPQTLGPWPSTAGALGIIAGDRTWNPLFSSWIPGPDDGKVSVARARLDGADDFVVMPSSHTWLMWRRSVLTQVQAFLHDGRFLRSSPSA